MHTAKGCCSRSLQGLEAVSRRRAAASAPAVVLAQGMATAALDHDAADFDEQDVLYDESDGADSEASEGPAPEAASDSEELLEMDRDQSGLRIEGMWHSRHRSCTAGCTAGCTGGKCRGLT